MSEVHASLSPARLASFFDRARARLTLEVPPALTDPAALGARGDLDLASIAGEAENKAHEEEMRELGMLEQ